MKRFIFFALLICSVTSFAANGKATPEPVQVISGRCNIFYFKVRKEFIGADYDVKDSSGKSIMTGKVLGHKSILDFYLESPGEYNITFSKDGELIEFLYEKFDPIPSWAEKQLAVQAEVGR